ncbi:MAG: hypothetical protein ACREO1_15215 [Arenimonas sp.]
MIENPYAAPASKTHDVQSVAEGEKRKLFSPTQGAVGAFFFAPLTGLYIVQANFGAMGEHVKRSNAIIYGSLLVLAITLAFPFLPEKIPGTAFGLLYMVSTRIAMDKYQLNKQQIADSQQYIFQSNWLVLGVGMLGIFSYLLVVIAMFLIYAALGLVPPLW